MGFLEELRLKGVLLDKGKIEESISDIKKQTEELDSEVDKFIGNNKLFSYSKTYDNSTERKQNSCIEIIAIGHHRVAEHVRYDFESKLCMNMNNKTYVSYDDRNKCSTDKSLLNHNVILSINGVKLEIADLDEAKSIYNKVKSILVGKGNSYLVIKHGKVTSETIPLKG